MNSGLRDPAAAVRGVGAGALGTEALVLLLAIVPLIKLRGPGAAIALVVVLALLALVLAALLRHAWAWYAAAVIPVALVGGGLLHGALAVVGVVFALLWAYVLHVRHSVLNGAAPSG
jgi:Protein of unknown function (DUF4233)